MASILCGGIFNKSVRCNRTSVVVEHPKKATVYSYTENLFALTDYLLELECSDHGTSPLDPNEWSGLSIIWWRNKSRSNVYTHSQGYMLGRNGNILMITLSFSSYFFYWSIILHVFSTKPSLLWECIVLDLDAETLYYCAGFLRFVHVVEADFTNGVTAWTRPPSK